MNQEEKDRKEALSFLLEKESSPSLEIIPIKFKRSFQRIWSRLLHPRSSQKTVEDSFFVKEKSSLNGEEVPLLTFELPESPKEDDVNFMNAAAKEPVPENPEESFLLISVILSDEKYQPLVNALQKDGIFYMNQLKGANLFYYVNLKNLYRWKERLEILEGVGKAFRSWNKYQASQVCPSNDKSFSSGVEHKNCEKLLESVTQTGLMNFPEIPAEDVLSLASNRVASLSLEVLEKKTSQDMGCDCKDLPDLPILHHVEKTQKDLKKPFPLSFERPSVDDFIKSKGLVGCDLLQVSKVCKLTTEMVMQRILENNNIIEIRRNAYIHRENIVGFDEAAAGILKILSRYFKKFRGYSSSKLLYDAINVDMSLFLNDNDFFSIEKIFFFAKHLFSKMNYENNCFFFYENLHIWEEEPDYPKTKEGLLIHYAREKRDLISLGECDNYLQKLCLHTSNIKKSVLHITEKPTFLQYDEDDTYLLGEFLNIDDNWILSVKKYLQKLCGHRSYVILRDIEEESLETLPKLPYGLSWRKLLLQEILGYYPECGYRTITTSLKGQKTTTLHAAIVPRNSSIETFPDLVEVLLIEELAGGKISWKGAPEELRKFLLEKGVLKGNELYNNMYTVLDDYRFAWTRDKSTVTYFLRP